jgi:hypothetical protein
MLGSATEVANTNELINKKVIAVNDLKLEIGNWKEDLDTNCFRLKD